MSNIEHWWVVDVPVARPATRLCVASEEVERLRDAGPCAVVGPLVPAEQLRGAVEENERLRAALEFYAEEDSEFDAGGVDGGRRALEALGLPLGGQ